MVASSPLSSVFVQIMGKKVCLRRKGKKLLGIVSFCVQKFVDNIQHCFVFSLKVKVMGWNPVCLLKYFLLNEATLLVDIEFRK